MGRGKLLTFKDYNKLTPTEQERCYEMANQETVEVSYVYPKDTVRTLVCRHLGCEVPIDDIFTEKVLPIEVLRELDEKIIKPTFELPTFENINDDEDNEEVKDYIDIVE